MLDVLAVEKPLHRLPPPHPKEHPDNALWVDEQIWGHRLWDSQSPWLIFLEFLVMAEACHRKGTLLRETGDQPFAYHPKQRMALRNIRIAQLTGDWNAVRFETIFQGRIARMVDPFEPGRANRLLVVRHNNRRIAIPSIPTELLASAHAVCSAKFTFEGDEPVLTGTIDYRLRQKQRSVSQRGAEIYSVAQNVWRRRGKRGHAATTIAPIRPKSLKSLGPFEVEVYWYNRRVVDAVQGLTESVTATRAEIARWSGGPMLYRHGFRILPYGDPNDDWLELDHNAFGQSGFKLNRQQVIGRVRVHSAHTALSEQTNREGLVRSDSADALRTLLMWLLHGEMREFINEADAAEQLTRRFAERASLEFRDTQEQVATTLRVLRNSASDGQMATMDRLTAQINRLSDQCASLVGKTQDLIKEASDEREKFVHLAGIGLMTEFIFHELDRSVDHTIRALADARASDKAAALATLEDQLHTLQKRISAFDELTGERRQTKSSFDLAEVVALVLQNHRNEFERHGIAVRFERPPDAVLVKAVRGMVIQIIENLIANATYWLKQQVRYQPGFSPELVIDLDSEEKTLTVEDNGPGIDPSRREVIFQPFITSKPVGQGRGLGLYISRELATYHGWKLYLEEQAGRRRPGRLSLFVLDFGGRA
jgi:signal transduction histidine kinase